jgi:AsmA protein
MNAKMKKALFILAGLAAAVVLAAVIFVLTFDINRSKPRIEAASSEVTGMKVRINGKLKLGLFPRPVVSLEDILIQNQGADVVSAKKAEVEIKLLPLVRRKILIHRVGLITPKFFITKDRRGLFNFETPELKLAKKKFSTGRPFEAGKIFIKNGHLLYRDETSGGKSEANECDLEIKNLAVVGGESIYAGSFEGDLSCREVKAKGLTISDFRVVTKARGGKFEANPLTMKIFGGVGRGSVKGVMSGESPEFMVDFAITKFRFEEVLETFKQKKSIRGELNLNSHLAMKGKNANEMKRTAQGEVSLRGQDLVHENIDLDYVLQKYEKTQHVSLVDMGAFFIAGPLGTVLTKGYDFGSVYTASLGGKSTIQKLVSDWKVKDGVAEAQDVAFSTIQNRVALQGSLDFVNERFDNVTVAVLDEKGCVRFWQKIHGDFRDPRVEKISTLRSIAGPFISMFKKTKDLLSGGECDIFYEGSVKHPK